MGFLFFSGLLVSMVKVVSLGGNELGVDVCQTEAWGVRLGLISDGLSDSGPEGYCSGLSLVIPRVGGMCTSDVQSQPRCF